MIQFTSNVGVAPGTTTVALPFAGPQQRTLGVCPPGHYGPAIMLPGSAAATSTTAQRITWDPYATESKLKGLHGASRMRWDLLALAFGLGFAGVLGYRWATKR